MKVKIKDYLNHYYHYFGYVIFLMICCVGVYKINQSFEMNDAFWHIKTGEWIVQHGMVKNCIGSWIIGDKPWMAHEWLFGVLIYLVSCMGMRWIVIGCHLLYLIVVYLCCKQAGLFRKNQNPPALYWMLVLLPQFAVYANMTVARPQYVSALFVAAFCVILRNAVLNKKYKPMYLLPIITVLWVNIHGGTAMLSYYMVGIVMLISVAGIFVKNIGKISFDKPDGQWIGHIFIVFVLVVAANLINPYGWHMLIYPYENMQDSMMLAYISEWASPDAKNVLTLVLEILPLLLGIFTIVQTDKQINASMLALFFLYIVLFLRSERFLTYLVIVQTCFIAPYAFQIELSPGKSKTLKNEIKLKQTHDKINNGLLLGITVIQVIFVIITVSGSQYSQENMQGIVPDELMTILEQDKPMRMLNHYNVGAYLMDHDIQVFVDGRYEPYKQQGVIQDYLDIMNPESVTKSVHMQELLEKYQFDAYLLSTTNVPLIMYLNKHPDKYSLEYQDENWLYYNVKAGET